jgi:hypothetical protein
MLVCGCGGWMHTEGVEERISREGDPTWFVRSECRPCQWVVGVDVPVGQVDGLVDRLMWTDDARHRLDRVPPYAVPVLRELVEGFARTRRQRVITYELIDQAKTGDMVSWTRMQSSASPMCRRRFGPWRALSWNERRWIVVNAL